MCGATEIQIIGAEDKSLESYVQYMGIKILSALKLLELLKKK